MAQLSDDAVRQLAEMIDREARDWARDWIAARKATLEKRKIKASGELISSIQSSARMTLESAVTNIVEIAFAEQGRFVDMKRLDVPGGGADYISNLAAWIQRKGLLAKYRAAFLIRNRRKKEPADLLYRMSWAVAMSRKTQKYRRRPWYAKAQAAGVNELYNRVAANLPDIVLQELTAAFPNP